MKPTTNKVPKHIGIILDGNRRFSKRLMLKPWKGHEWGARKVEALFEWCKELNIKELTLYAFSEENFNRPKKEFDYLMKVFKKEFSDLLKDKRVDEERIRINVIGRIWKFPRDLQKLLRENMERTKNYNNYVINFALGYSGRGEVVDATVRIANKVKNGSLTIDKINEEVFKENLYLESEPDLIIRTGGEKRTSGFLLWQGSYAELFFCDKLWPEFTKDDLKEAIIDFNKRERRFGR